MQGWLLMRSSPVSRLQRVCAQFACVVFVLLCVHTSLHPTPTSLHGDSTSMVGAYALRVQWGPSENETVWYWHEAADFGPQVFDVAGPAVFAVPATLCDPPTINVTGAMLIAIRTQNNCSFFQKALRAQAAGAVALLIDSLSEDLIGMVGTGDSTLITIPVVSIQRSTTDDIRLRMSRAVNFTTTLLLDPRWQYSPQDFPGQSLKLLTIMILVLPAGWLICFFIYYIRRTCRTRVARVVRTRIAHAIPLVPYQRVCASSVSVVLSPLEGTTKDTSDATGTPVSGVVELKVPDSASGLVSPSTAMSNDLASATSPTPLIAVTVVPVNMISSTTSIGSSSASSVGSGHPTTPGPVAIPSSPTGAATVTGAMAMSPTSPVAHGYAGGQKVINDSCAICLEDFEDGMLIKVLPCGHGFHGPCIDPWLDERSDLCPICKQSIIALNAAAAARSRKRCDRWMAWCICCCTSQRAPSLPSSSAADSVGASGSGSGSNHSIVPGNSGDGGGVSSREDGPSGSGVDGDIGLAMHLSLQAIDRNNSSTGGGGAGVSGISNSSVMMTAPHVPMASTPVHVMDAPPTPTSSAALAPSTPSSSDTTAIALAASATILLPSSADTVAILPRAHPRDRASSDTDPPFRRVTDEVA